MSRIIDVVCFSGTGNTRLAVDRIAEILRENGIEVCEKSERTPYVHEQGHELLLAFPINSQAVSPYIWKYFKSLPDGNGDRVHVLLTLNESAAILKPLHKLLTEKNFVPQGCAEISMPNHLLVGEGDTTYKRLPSAKDKAESFAKEIAENRDTWQETMKGSAFVSFLSRDTVLPWFVMRLFNRLETDTDKCVKCGLCVKECPVGNIRMEEFPVHMSKCQFCMRCGAMCPSGAIGIKGKPKYSIRKPEQCLQENEK